VITRVAAEDAGPANGNSRRRRPITAFGPVVAIVGYTNAGKSTLLNTLTYSDVLAAPALSTLDTARAGCAFRRSARWS